MSNLKIEYVSKDKLKPYAKNAKLHTDDQVEQIKRSIEEFGFNDPIAVWHEDEIIEGHGRLLAVMEMPEIETVPIIRLDDLTDEQRRAYMLVHNKLTMNTDFDFELLDSELDNIIDIDMAEFGFDIEIEDDDEPEEIIDDEVPEEVETRCKLGDIWQCGNHRLICADSTSIEQIDRLMNGEYADMVFTDPPWNVNYGAQQNHPSWKPRQIMNDSMTTDEFKEFMYNAFKAMNNASKAGCMTYVVMSAQEWGNMMLTLAENDYHWSSTIIWNKDQLVLSRKDYHTKYEPIWYGWKAGEARLCPLEDRKQCDVWDFERPKRSDEHPTMKPVPLVARAITNSSKKGNNVLDLFGGSGTTLIACEQTGRKCFMSELDPKYCDVIIQRWENLTGKKAELISENLNV